MAVPMHVAARMTTQEFLRLPETPDGLRLELLDGEVVTMNPPTPRHQAVFVPDIQWFSAQRSGLHVDARLWPVGDIVAEVRSESTARYDRELKCRRYLALGAREVWLVDPGALTVEIHQPAGDPVLLGPDASLTSPLLPGFTLPLVRLRVD